MAVNNAYGVMPRPKKSEHYVNNKDFLAALELYFAQVERAKQNDILSFLFWLNFSPVYRFAVPYFLSLFFIFSINFYLKRDFSKKIFLLLISISLIFSFSKNILRLKNQKELFFGIEKINNKFYKDKKSNNKFVNIYRPDIDSNKNGWQGRLCWNIPFLCSYNHLNVDKKYGYLILSKLKK